FGGGGFKMCEIGGRPPVAHASLRVKCASFGVEGVTDFVSHDGTNRPIIGRGGCLRVEEWPLENGGGEAESVLQWEIDGVDGLGSHGPFLAVNRSAQPRDFTVIPKQAAAPDVAKDVIRLHFVGRVVSPRFRIAYTHIQI